MSVEIIEFVVRRKGHWGASAVVAEESIAARLVDLLGGDWTYQPFARVEQPPLMGDIKRDNDLLFQSLRQVVHESF